MGIIEQYAVRFHLDPDTVFHKPFHDVMAWIVKWKEQAEFEDRYRKVQQNFSDNETK